MACRSPCAAVVWLLVLAVARSAPNCTTLEQCQGEVTRLASENARLAAEVAESKSSGESAPLKFGSPGFIRNTLMAFVCVVFAALAAGLTMGLVSLDPMEMEIIVKSEEKDKPDEKDRQKLKLDQACAKSILPLIQDHHRLLVTLLLMNSLANEALPLFLDAVVPSWLAVILSVTLVLMFGEIIPSAVFTGSEQLRIAAKFAPIVSALQCLLAPVAWPIAKVLDYILGEEHKGRYNFAELRAIVGIHAGFHSGEPQPVTFKHHDNQGLGIITTETEHKFSEQSTVLFSGVSTKLLSDGTPYYVKPCAPLKGRDTKYTFRLYPNQGRHARDAITFAEGELTKGTFTLKQLDELKIMDGVMRATHMTAKDAMVPLSKAYTLDCSQPLTSKLAQEIYDEGYSRVPVYSKHRHNLRGFILVKKLIVTKDENVQGRSVESLGVNSLVVVEPTTKLLDLLNKFQENKCHMAVVTNNPEEVQVAWQTNVEVPPDVHLPGIITLEDIIEKLLQEPIDDEHDALQQQSKIDLLSSSPNAKREISGADWGRTRTRSGNGGLDEPLLSSGSGQCTMV